MAEAKDAVAEAYRTINEADPVTQEQLKRLRSLYEQTGEDPERYEKTIDEILTAGPGAADRLKGTADAVAALWKIKE